MIAVLGGPEVHALGWQFCYEIVAINAGTMLVLAVLLNALIPGRRYPMFHSHHPHHEKYASIGPWAGWTASSMSVPKT